MATADNYGLFWNSDNGDRKYSADSFERWLRKFFTSGVFEGDLQVTELSGMNVNVQPGYCNLFGKVGLFEVANSLTLEAANSRYPRIDTIVVERSDTDRTIYIHVVTGSYSGDNPEPTAPVWDETLGVYQLVLAQIYVGAGVSAISQADITDKRMDSSVCGYITGTVEEIDFSQISAQFNSYFENFKATSIADFNTWKNAQEANFETWEGQQQTAFSNWRSGQESDFTTWKDAQVADFTSWEIDQKTAYQMWFNTVKAQQIADKAAWDEWYADLQEELHNLPAETAEYLQLEIDDIRNNGLSGSIIKITTINTSLIGKNVSVTNSDGTEVKYGVFDSNGECVINGFRSVGTITVSSTDGTQTASTTYNIPYFGNYTIAVAFWAATVNIQGDNEMANGTVAVTNSSDVIVGTVTLNPSARGSFTAMEADTYTFEIASGEKVATSTVVVTQETTYNTTLHYWGATVQIQGDATLMANGVVVVYDANNRERGRVVLDLTSYGEFTAIEPGAYRFDITNGTRTDSKTVVVTQETTYSVVLHYWGATVQIQGDAQMASGTITVKDNNNTVIGSVNLDANSYGEYLAIAAGTYKFSISSGALTAEETLTISAEGTYPLIISYWVATIAIQADSELYGATVTIKDSNDSTVGTVTLNSSGVGSFDVHEADTYTLHATFQSRDYSTQVIVSDQDTYAANLTVWKAIVTIEGDENLRGSNVTVKDSNSQTIGIVTLNATTGIGTINIYLTGTYTFTTTYGGDTFIESLNVINPTTYTVELSTFVSVTLYSAANDTVYYVKNGSNVIVATTDTSGKAENVNVPSNVTLYSTIAEATDDSHDAYSKSFNGITAGDTIYLMPEHTLFWYGYMIWPNLNKGSGSSNAFNYSATDSTATNDEKLVLKNNKYLYKEISPTTKDRYVVVYNKTKVDVTNFSTLNTKGWYKTTVMYVGASDVQNSYVRFGLADSITGFTSTVSNIKKGFSKKTAGSASNLIFDSVDISTTSGEYYLLWHAGVLKPYNNQSYTNTQNIYAIWFE